ncbi:MAG: HD domain-containing phosphohydrolase [Vicinamibacterales bacterium]
MSGTARAGTRVSYADVLAGLSYALDLTEGQRPGHSVRSAVIGLRLADVIGLDPARRESLVHALLMKDLGCSSNAARFSALFGASDHDLKSNLKLIDWPVALQSFRFVSRNVAPGRFWLKRVWRALAVFARGPAGAREVVRTRCERGADIATMLGFSTDTAAAIRALDEHWNGQGQPYRLAGEAIPPLARILNLAQTAEVFGSTWGPEAMFTMATDRRGRWFDPSLVDALQATRHDTAFWERLSGRTPMALLRDLDLGAADAPADDERLDRTAVAFAQVIDAKSPWTFRHSNGVAAIAVGLGQRLGFDDVMLRDLYRAGLLHDLGKLGVSSLILDKPGRLTDEEFRLMRHHPVETAAILDRVPCFQPIVELAASHHERLDGRGYHRGLTADRLSMAQRVLCTADICDALRMSRPYRAGLEPEQVLDIMSREVSRGIDPRCYEALEDLLRSAPVDLAVALPAARLVESLAEDYSQAA